MAVDAIFGSENLSTIEALYESFLLNKESVDPDWRAYFEALSQEAPLGKPLHSSSNNNAGKPASIFNAHVCAQTSGDMLSRQERVDHLIRAYRVRAHAVAHIDPLGKRSTTHPELELAFHGLTEEDLDRPCSSRTLIGSGSENKTLRDVVTRMRNTYCRSIGVQYMHIDDLTVRTWLQVRM